MHWLIYFLTWQANKDKIWIVLTFINHIELNSQVYSKFIEFLI